MYLWRRFAAQKWAHRNEEGLRRAAGDKLTVVERPDRKRLQFEVASTRRTDLQDLTQKFGGRIERLPDDWLKRFSRVQQVKPLRIGTRLFVASSRNGALQSAVYKKAAGWKPPLLVIPAGAAFGTGEHATTAMSLRLLERVMRFWGAQAPPPANASPARTFGAPAENVQKSSRSRGRDCQQARRLRSPDLVVDLGTGSGILALAAKCLGARRVAGIDNDPIAISTAKQNAALNKIRGVKFRVADVRQWRSEAGADVVTANLFSDLLIEILPRLRGTRRLILSGILRNQEKAVRRALTGIKAEVLEVRRRGKWVAMLAGRK